MSCSLKIRYADVEVEFTGEETFAEKHLLPLIQALSKALEIGDAGAVSKTPIEKRALQTHPIQHSQLPQPRQSSLPRLEPTL
jgi:hypothetical protein